MRQVIGLFLCTAMAFPAIAARPVKTTGNLDIQHRRMLVVNPEKIGTKLEASNTYLLVSGESVVVYVQDRNPLIYTYKWTKKDGVDTTDFKNASAFVAVLETFAGALGAVPQTDPVEEVQNQADRMDRLAMNADTAGERAAATDRRAAADRLGSVADNARARVGLTEGFWSESKSNIDELKKYLESYPKIALASITDSDQAFATHKTRADEILKAVEAARTNLKTATDYRNLLASGEFAKMLKAANADTQTMLNDIIGTVQTLAVVTQMGEITKAIDAAEDLANRVKVVNTPLRLGELSFVATKTDPADLEIKYTEAFDALSGAQRKPVIEASDAKPGTYEFVASPYSPVTLGLGPTMVYSFTERPTYEAQATTDGKFRIVRTDEGDDISGFDLGAMLTLTPTSWRNEIFEPHVQVGIAPGDDNTGIFAGVGFTFYRNVSLGGGISFERIEQLVPALHEGDLLTTADELKTSKQFDTGFYLNLSMTFKLR